MTGAGSPGPGGVTGVPPVVTVDLGPGVRAGFTTAGWNLSEVVGDDPEGAAARWDVLARWAGGPVARVRQVHGAAVAVLGPGVRVAATTQADALVTADRGRPLAVLVADCVPVLLADDRAGVVAAVHAGRRGVAAGVAGAAVAAMVARGARADRVRAVVGPAICGRCYEVPEALQAEVAVAVPASRSTTSWGTPALDLPAAVRAQLHDAGLVAVSDPGVCTLTDHRWYSHRATDRAPGRFAAVISLEPAPDAPDAPDGPVAARGPAAACGP